MATGHWPYHQLDGENSQQVFALVALLIFLEMVGIFYGNTLFWAVTLTVYMLGIIMVR